MRTERIDIDGTIATPCFFHEDFEHCQQWYLRAGIVKQKGVASLQFHQQLFLLPHTLLTHHAITGAVQALQMIARQGSTWEDVPVRQHGDPVVCELMHRHACIWLEQ